MKYTITVYDVLGGMGCWC